MSASIAAVSKHIGSMNLIVYDNCDDIIDTCNYSLPLKSNESLIKTDTVDYSNDCNI